LLVGVVFPANDNDLLSFDVAALAGLLLNSHDRIGKRLPRAVTLLRVFHVFGLGG
jgi:hypothetical protein